MISLGRTGRVFAHASPADLRNGFDGLAALVAEHLGAEATSGDLYRDPACTDPLLAVPIGAR